MKIAVITGASSGMGLEFAKAIDAEETLDEIWLIARRRERLEDLAKELRTPARILPMDLGDAASFDEYKKLLEEEKPLVSTLCNVAGFGRFALFTETPLEVNLNMIDINDKALVAMTQLTLPYMKRGSRVINLDSLSAFQPVPYQCIYGSTKAFVLSFSRALNVELEPRGIRVMAVVPRLGQDRVFRARRLRQRRRQLLRHPLGARRRRQAGAQGLQEGQGPLHPGPQRAPSGAACETAAAQADNEDLDEAAGPCPPPSRRLT